MGRAAGTTEGGSMKRLTFDGNFCDIAMCQETPGSSFCEDGYCTQRKVWDRLKQYEDMEEQGLLVWLPCKVGDWVYRVIRLKNGSGHVAPAIVGGLHLADTTRNRRYQKEYEYIVLKGVFGGFIAHVNKKEFGKTVFLTREEAEKALEDA